MIDHPIDIITKSPGRRSGKHRHGLIISFRMGPGDIHILGWVGVRYRDGPGDMVVEAVGVSHIFLGFFWLSISISFDEAIRV